MFQKAKHVSTSRGLVNFLRHSCEVKNLYCQYFSGLIGENIDERIFNIALENLKNFKGIILFEDYDNEIKKFFNGFNISEINEKFYINKSSEKVLKKEEKESIKIYNYWDLKLYEEILKTKNFDF